MRAFVFGAGEIYSADIEEKVQDGDLVVCADKGYHNAKAIGAHVNVLVGDFDSIDRIPDDVNEIVRVPAKKDLTDLQLAVKEAVDRGANDIIIMASTNGRLDHTLSLVCILEDLWDKKIPAHIVNGQNRIRFLRDSGVIIVRSAYKYFSVVALDKKVKGVTINGGEYPLIKKEINRAFQYAVSNEINKNCALIEIKRGSVLVIESRDI